MAGRLLLLSLAACGHALRLAPAVRGVRHPVPRMHHVDPNEHHMEPSADLDVLDVIKVICRGLQENDVPKQDAGMERLYNFCTPAGRVAIAPPPPRSGLQGGVTLEYWLEVASSPALGALTFCSSFELIGDPVMTPGTNTRGRFCTQLVEVGNSPLVDESDKSAALQRLVKGTCDLPLRIAMQPCKPRCALTSICVCVRVHMLAADDSFLESVLTAVRDGGELPKAPPETEIKTRFWFAMEEQRRPPQQGCWLLKEILPLKKTIFQELQDGGEEFEGEDTG